MNANSEFKRSFVENVNLLAMQLTPEKQKFLQEFLNSYEEFKSIVGVAEEIEELAGYASTLKKLSENIDRLQGLTDNLELLQALSSLIDEDTLALLEPLLNDLRGVYLNRADFGRVEWDVIDTSYATSGVLTLARNLEALLALRADFEQGEVLRASNNLSDVGNKQEAFNNLTENEISVTGDVSNG